MAGRRPADIRGGGAAGLGGRPGDDDDGGELLAADRRLRVCHARQLNRLWRLPVHAAGARSDCPDRGSCWMGRLLHAERPALRQSDRLRGRPGKPDHTRSSPSMARRLYSCTQQPLAARR